MTHLRNNLRLRPDQNRDEVDQQIENTQQKYADRLAAYQYPRTAQEWWDVLRDWWPEITAIWRMYLPAMSNMTDKELLDSRKMRVPQLEELCHRAWSAAPDNGSIHAIPGWSVLCDLCSESGVLYDQDKQDGTRITVPVEEGKMMPEEFIKRLIALCKEFDARIFARSVGKGFLPAISIVFGNDEKDWVDYRRINAEEGALRIFKIGKVLDE